MKKTFLLVPLAIILVMSLFLVSCEDEPELKSYTVTFLLDESDTEPFDKKTVLEGAGITDAKVPEKTGHKFLNWKTIEGNDAYELNTPVKGDLTLVAVWEINKYTVSFMDGETKAADPQTVEYGKTAIAPTAPTQEGHTFSCWKKVGSSSPFDFETEVITEDTVLEAVWDINTYTVTFYNEDGTSIYSTTSANHGLQFSSVVKPTPEKTGHVLIGWSTEKGSTTAYDSSKAIEGNMNLYPIWEKGQYKVSFICGEGAEKVPQVQAVEFEGKAIVPEQIPTRTGYKFKHWAESENSGHAYDFDTAITKDVELYAVYETLKISVSFYDEKGDLIPSSNDFEWGKDNNFPVISDKANGFDYGWLLEGETSPTTGSSFNLPYSKNEYKFHVYITTDLLTITNTGSVSATNILKDSTTITYLSIPHSIEGIAVKSIGYGGFKNCTSLNKIIIPDGVEIIRYYAFQGCSGLESITIPKGVTSIQGSAFYGCSSLNNITIPGTVTSIGNEAFVNCSSLTSIIIPDGVTSIQDSAFSGCSSLKNITIPGTVTSIGNYAFNVCSNLTSITIPESVTSIGNNVFNSSGLISITIPKSVTSIGSYPFYRCNNLTEINVSEGNKNFVSEDGVLIDITNNILICYPAEKTGDTYTVPNNVTIIAGGAFAVCKNIKEVTLQEGVTSINNSAFIECSNLSSINIPNGVTAINSYAFQDCTSLTSITIPASCKTIGGYAFNTCSSLETVIINDGCTSIGDKAFRWCKNLTSIVVPSTVTSFGDWVFGQCTRLASANIKANVMTIDGNTFNGCTELKTVSLSSSISSLEDYTFVRLFSLETIKVDQVNTAENPSPIASNAPWGAPNVTKDQVQWKIVE